MKTRIAAIILALALLFVAYPIVRSPLIRADVFNDYAARRAKYFGLNVELVGDSNIGANTNWGWHLSHDPLDALSIATYGATLFQIQSVYAVQHDIHPKAIVLMAGSSDAWVGVPIEQSVKYYRTLIRNAKRHTERVIVVLAPPTRSRLQSDRLKRLNDALRPTLATERVEVVELPEIGAADGLIKPQYVAPDGVHLNYAGYRIVENKLRSLRVG